MTTDFLEAPLLDPIALQKLRTVAGDQGPQFVAEMAQLFVDETKPALAELRRAKEEGNWKQVGRIAHSLKSSAATLGLMRLSTVCKALELDTKQGGSNPGTDGLLSAVFTQFELAEPTLKDLR